MIRSEGRKGQGETRDYVWERKRIDRNYRRQTHPIPDTLSRFAQIVSAGGPFALPEHRRRGT